MMDLDLDYDGNAGGTLYGARAIMLDPTTNSQFLQGTLNAMCVGITPQESLYPPGGVTIATAGISTPPFIYRTIGKPAGAYGQGRKCIWDVDDTWAGIVRPNDLLICGNGGLCRRASPFGPWNQWILAIALSFASPGFGANVRIIGPWAWSPTGS
jgi:hypothetical protein